MMLYLESVSTLRPHLVTYTCLAVMGVFLLRHRELVRWQEMWPLLPLQVAWTNCHSGFVLGPLLVGGFGLEMALRKSCRQERPAWPVLRLWGIAFLLVLASCLVNPSGWARFYPPFYQGGLESIRAYVFEMQPRLGVLGSIFTGVGAVTGAAVLPFILCRRGAFSYCFLALTALFFFESLSVQKSWPIFGILLPLTVVSCGVFGPPEARSRLTGWPSFTGNLLLASLLAAMFWFRMGAGAASPGSLSTAWSDYQLGRRDLPYPAVKWMVEKGIEGRLLHRCEDGGFLQLIGYDRGQTFGDTGFGKYDEKQIHLVAMLGERPGLLPLYVAAYHPSFILCNNYCFGWPVQLRRLAWRLIFFSPYSEVWAAPGVRTDLPAISDAEVEATFARDWSQHGRPHDIAVVGRSIVTLNSLGLQDFARGKLNELPSGLHQLAFYWEAASIMCFEDPPLPAAQRQQFFQEATALREDDLTAGFRAQVLDQNGDQDDARKILEAVPRPQFTPHAADLLLKIDNEQKRPEALALAQQRSLFELRDGRHWEYLAQAEERAGHTKQATRAWKQAVFYFPDDAQLMAGAKVFVTAHPDAALEKAVSASTNVRDN